MKHKLFFILLLTTFAASSANYHIAPSGSDICGNSSYCFPSFSLNKIWPGVSAGDTIFCHGGTYQFSERQYLISKSGTDKHPIVICNYPDEKPVFTKTSENKQDHCIYLWGNYITISGIEICGFTQNTPLMSTGIYAINCIHCMFQNLNLHNNGGSGLASSGGGKNTFKDIDSHHNYDPLTLSPYDNSDGICIENITDVTDTTWVIGCRFYSNADDGLDLWKNEGIIIIHNCWSFSNGYREDGKTPAGNGNGFKMGKTEIASPVTVKRIVTNCLSFCNRSSGFQQNGANCGTILYNNTSFSNLQRGFDFSFGSTVNSFKNNISYLDGMQSARNTASTSISNNTFQFVSTSKISTTSKTLAASETDFISTDSTGISGQRNKDYNLPVLPFLRLSEKSNLADKGINVGLPFTGNFPDIGAFEKK